MKNIVNAIIFSICTLLMTSCNKEVATPYDNPFFYIHLNQASEINVQEDRNQTIAYPVYFSTKLQYEPIDVYYEIIVGDGLKEGVDFELINKENKLTFKPGYFEMPIEIKWIKNTVDPTKDNSLTIQLLSNTKNLTVGLPGPDKNQSSLKIVKVK